MERGADRPAYRQTWHGAGSTHPIRSDGSRQMRVRSQAGFTRATSCSAATNNGIDSRLKTGDLARKLPRHVRRSCLSINCFLRRVSSRAWIEGSIGSRWTWKPGVLCWVRQGRFLSRPWRLRPSMRTSPLRPVYSCSLISTRSTSLACQNFFVRSIKWNFPFAGRCRANWLPRIRHSIPS